MKRNQSLFIALYDSERIIPKEIIGKTLTVNGEYYWFLSRLRKRVKTAHLECCEQGSWSMFHKIPPTHNCINVRDFLLKEGIIVLSHLPQSPDLIQCDFYFFRKHGLIIKDNPTIPSRTFKRS